jgi:hypothetical protein
MKRKYSILLILLILCKLIIAQTTQSAFNFESSIIITIKTTIDSDERARYIDKLFLSNNEIVFAYTDFSEFQTTIVSSKNISIKELNQCIRETGYQIIDFKEIAFDTETFVKTYNEAKYKKPSDIQGKPPVYYTNQKQKDEINYQKFCELWQSATNK